VEERTELLVVRVDGIVKITLGLSGLVDNSFILQLLTQFVVFNIRVSTYLGHHRGFNDYVLTLHITCRINPNRQAVVRRKTTSPGVAVDRWPSLCILKGEARRRTETDRRQRDTWRQRDTCTGRPDCRWPTTSFLLSTALRPQTVFHLAAVLSATVLIDLVMLRKDPSSILCPYGNRRIFTAVRGNRHWTVF
jgi:hypothetical protein